MEYPRREVSDDEPRFIVRIEGTDAEGRRVHGTGFFVSEAGHVATCLHVVRKLMSIQVKHPYEKPWKYRIVSRDEDRDLAILAGMVPLNFAPPIVVLARNKEFNGVETLRFYGWSDSENYSAPRSRTCTFAAYSEKNDLIGLNANADPGDSGAPVLDERNEVVALIRVRDKDRTGHAMAIPVEALHPLLEGLVAARETRSPRPAVVHRLLQSSRPQFERLLLLAAVPQQRLPPYAAGLDARARAAAEFLDSTEIEKLTEAIARDSTFGAVARERLWTAVSRAFPPLYRAFRRYTREPFERGALEDYHTDLVRRMKEENSVQLIEQNVGVIEESSDPDPFGSKVRRGVTVHRIRHLLRYLSGLTTGGDQESAQLASLHRRSRVVRDAVATLLSAEQPVILLGEPGSGKSMTLREVARDLVRRKHAGPRPPVVVYARLGMYRAVSGDGPGDVVEFIRSQIPPQFESVRDAIPTFIAEGRLIVLFDGMDEMERRRYNERVRALSEFASAHAGSVKALFSCRINDFTPEFRHHQLVLLPFGESQVAEFVRKNVHLPRTVDGTTYKRHAPLIRDLQSRPGLSDFINNPLMLFLTCSYIVSRESWPQTRAALFRNFIEQHLENMRDGQRITFAAGEPESLFEGWAAVGFDLIQRGASDAVVEDVAPRLVELGTAAGLLQIDPDDANRVRFTHHRFKEYFAALHIASLPVGTVPWQDVLDEAGWQETLLNLVSIDPENEAIEELQHSITEGVAELRPTERTTLAAQKLARKEGMPFWLRNAEGERMLADRVVLASHIIRETAADRAVLPDGFEEEFYAALSFLAEHGRPTSQVKMLWAWKNAPGPSVAAALEQPINSNISWVRDQAILLVGAVGGTDLSRNLGSELAADFAAERVLGRLKTYLRAARASKRWTCAVLAAALGNLGFLAAAVFVTIAGATYAVYSASPYPLEIITDASAIAFLVGLALVIVPMVGEEGVGTGRRLIFAGGVAALGWKVLWVAIHHGVFAGLFAAFGLIVTMSWIPGVITEVVFWPISFLFVFVLNSLSPSRTRSMALRIMRTSPAIGWTWRTAGPALLGVIVLGILFLVLAVIAALFLKLPDLWFDINWSTIFLVARWGLLVVPATLVIIYLVMRPFRALEGAAERVGNFLESAGGVMLYLIFLFWGIPLLKRFFTYLGRFFGRNWLFWISATFIVLILIGLAVALVIYYKHFLTAVLLRARRSMPVEEWIGQMTSGEPALQREYLRVDRSHFAPSPLTASEYLELLAKVELHVTKEPAVGEYWRLRQQMEQAVRQDRRGD